MAVTGLDLEPWLLFANLYSIGVLERGTGGGCEARQVTGRLLSLVCVAFVSAGPE